MYQNTGARILTIVPTDILMYYVMAVDSRYDIVLLLFFFSLALNSSCPVFGSDVTQQLKDYGQRSLFLNFQTPSQCSGTVIGWNFCFFRNQRSIGETLTATVRVYRRQNDSIYLEVPNSQKNINIISESLQVFTCMSLPLKITEYFQIQENDIVAAYVPPKKYNIRALKVIGYDSSVKSLTYKTTNMVRSMCTSPNLAVVNVSTFRVESISMIHLYAQLGK